MYSLSLVAEESLAHRVCLLLIELQLCVYQPDKTLALIAYIENQFVVSTDSVISSEKDVKPLEKEHKEKKVHIELVNMDCQFGWCTN
jgi:CCR4-NOT transcription complex subunit 10